MTSFGKDVISTVHEPISPWLRAYLSGKHVFWTNLLSVLSRYRSVQGLWKGRKCFSKGK